LNHAIHIIAVLATPDIVQVAYYWPGNHTQNPPVITTGVILDYKLAQNCLYLEIQPDDPCLMTKWRSEVTFRAYAE